MATGDSRSGRLVHCTVHTVYVRGYAGLARDQPAIRINRPHRRGPSFAAAAVSRRGPKWSSPIRHRRGALIIEMKLLAAAGPKFRLARGPVYHDFSINTEGEKGKHERVLSQLKESKQYNL